ncbi:MAG: hypothetical protein HY696_00285, partial [Deltaproteobacteria bacterium]|nr:hypothetical protein [Deltaproteobacteria bacterium]
MTGKTTGVQGPTGPLATALTRVRAGLAAGQAPAALQATHGPAVAAAVWGLPGGEQAPALGVVRSWIRGRAVEAARFAASVDALLTGCAQPDALAAPAVFVERRDYFAPQRQRVPTNLDAFGFFVFATPAGPQRVDPLLDTPAVFRSFAALEALVAQGPRLEVPGLGVRAYAPPGTRLTTLTDLYARLQDGAHQLWLLDTLVYVLPTAQCPPALAADLATAAIITPITAVPITPASTDHSTPPLPFLVPAVVRDGAGPADLAALLAAARAYWLTPAARPPWHDDDLTALPSLVTWLQAQASRLHPTDLRRCTQVHQALGHATGAVRAGQVAAAVDHLVGICAEIALRPAVLATFMTQAPTDPTLGLWVEGELATPDGHRISDAVLGRLAVAARAVQLVTAWELAAGPRSTAAAADQHTHTLAVRLPAQGLILAAPDGRWAHVTVDATAAERHTQSLAPAAATALRALAEQAMAESLAYWAIHAAVHGTIPAEERRRYRGVRGLQAAGRLWDSVVAELWATALARPGPVDLSAVVAALEARRRHFPVAGRLLVAAELACLHNLAVPLSPAGPRQAARALARSSGVSPPTIQTIQARLTDALTAAGIAVHADPAAAQGVASRAGHTVGPIVATLLTTWQEQPPSDRTAEA